MKTYIRNLFLLPALIAGLGLIPARQMTAQTFTTLHNFTGGSNDGGTPKAGLILSGNTLYGTAQGGGPSGNGTVFAVNTDGTGFTNLHSFTATPSYPFPSTNSDGVGPQAGLILSGNTLYGTALSGGSSGNGTVFALNTNGTGFTNLYSFTATLGTTSNSDGAFPYAGLILSGNTLYGTATYGGSSGVGTVFAVNTDGTGFTNLHSFTSGSDGAYPYAGLILSGNTLYGTTAGANSLGSGTVFALNTDGTGFTNLHSFNSDSDGAYPYARLVLSSNTLYGTAYNGGSSGGGTVFAVNTDGTGFTNLHSFTYGSDGAYPRAGLILSGNTLYGAALAGGRSGNGTVFALNTDGADFTPLHSFTYSSDGAGPFAVILSGNTLYGTSFYGSLGYGTVFSLSLAPQLTMTRSGANVILIWPTKVAGFDYTGFTLQSTTNFTVPNSWSPVAQTATTNAGQISVTVPTTVGRKFFRLKSQ